MLGEKKQPRILDREKLSFKSGREIKTFLKQAMLTATRAVRKNKAGGGLQNGREWGGVRRVQGVPFSQRPE